MQVNGSTPVTPLAPSARPRAASSFRWFALLKSVGAGVAVGLLVFLIMESFSILIGSNFHEVVPGSIYRCATLSGPEMARDLKKYKIRTVINLRGCCASDASGNAWYFNECHATSQMNVSQEDLGFSAGRLPSVDTIRQLVEVLERSDYPILVHCQRGIDRTGMTVAMALLLRTDCSLDDALYQLGPRYGHLPLGRTGNIDRFFVLYQEWLNHKGFQHSRATFRHWVLDEYCPGECRCYIEVLEPKGASPHVPLGRPFGVRIRCHNTSVKPWRFRPGTDAGIHAVWQLFNEEGTELPGGFGRSGLFHAEVQPGESIDLTLSIPALRQPGHYQLRIDMKDEQHAFFFQLGEEPLFWDMEAP